ncbi:MAG: acyltransferase family protein [Novosphingobium sp.]
MTARTREIASLDVMRLAAAQAVMFYHLVFMSWAEEGSRGIRAVVGTPVVFADAVVWASLGWIGVQIFFVISGFVILMSAQDKSASDFLIGRVTRIVPALWFFTVLSGLVILASGVLSVAELTPRFLRSMVLFPVGPWVDGAVWTLVTEALFYAVVFGIIKAGKIGRVTAIAGAVTAFNLVFWCIVLAGEAGALGETGHWLAGGASSYKLRVTLISTNCYFVTGASLYQIFMGRSVGANSLMFVINFGVGLISTYYAARSSLGVSAFGQDPALAAAAWGILTLLMSACVLMRVGSGARFVRFATVAGLLTYPLYLINQITGGYLLGLAYRTGLSPVLAVLLTAAACTVLAGLFAMAVERPLQLWLKKGLRQIRRSVLVPREA